jgi:hypothetical protein
MFNDDTSLPPFPAAPADLFALWEQWTRPWTLYGPLSGPVNQAIQAMLARNLGQLGVVNINTGAAGDPQLERRIVDQVASYGRQLGWVVDALSALIDAQRGVALNAQAERALDQVHRLHGDVENVKRRAAVERLDALVDQVALLRDDPNAVARLRQALGDD